MPDIATFVEEQKKLALYQQQAPPDLSKMMLETWPENRRYNQRMTWYKHVWDMNCSNLQEPFRSIFSCMFDDITIMNLSLGDKTSSRSMALQAKAVQVQLDDQEKKKGIMGIFSQKE